MITKTFINKSNTIIKGSKENFGLNPICMLHYGDMISRFLIHFDVENLKEIHKNITEKSNIKHYLNMFNCGSIENKLNETINSFNGSGERKRAVSFDIIAFEVPMMWDEGVGFDSSLDFWFNGTSAVSESASTWYKSNNIKPWDYDGIYSLDILKKEYENFISGKESIIISCQHFDHGNENLHLDITEYIQKIINGEKPNNGICLAFSPYLEKNNGDIQYVGFFNNHTNTIFHPFIETRWGNYINDNRFDFTLNKNNKLYLYAKIGGELASLDELPTCSINGEQYEVKQSKNGVYYVDIFGDRTKYEKDTIYYDVWSNIKYEGVELDDVEMEFVVYSPSSFFNIGKPDNSIIKYTPLIHGVNESEDLVRGEEREIKVYFKRNYTYNEYDILKNAEYRIYVMNANKEVDIIQWDSIDCIGDCNSFLIKTNEFLPSTYYVDIKTKHNGEVKIFKKCLKFTVVSNSTNIKK